MGDFAVLLVEEFALAAFGDVRASSAVDLGDLFAVVEVEVIEIHEFDVGAGEVGIVGDDGFVFGDGLLQAVLGAQGGGAPTVASS